MFDFLKKSELRVNGGSKRNDSTFLSREDDRERELTLDK